MSDTLHGLHDDEVTLLQPKSFLRAYAAAWSGGAIAYTPFLTLLLPARFSELAGVNDVPWLAFCATMGAIAASLSNIFWGWASDASAVAGWHGRKPWIAIGLVATGLTSVGIATATTASVLVIAVSAWQVTLNLLLGPMGAYAADSVPDRQKGVLGGMMSFGPALAALTTIAVSFLPVQLSYQLGLIMLVVTLCVLPLLLAPTALPLGAEAGMQLGARGPRYDRRTLWLLWLARLFVQVAEGLLFLFMFYFLRSVSGGTLSLFDYGWTNALAQFIAIPVALIVGRLSDRSGRRKAALLAMVGLIAAGLAGMANLNDWSLVVACYCLFLMGSNSFLALHAALVMHELPDPRYFGRDLGVFNLTNTLPSLTTPVLAAFIIGRFGYHTMLGMLAIVMLVPALFLAQLRMR